MLDKRYLEILDGLFEGVYIVDKDRKIIYWNEGSEKITGYKAKEIMNNYCYNNILQHVDLEGNQLCFNGCPLQHTLETAEVNENDVFLHHKKGHRVPVTVRTSPIYDNNGEVIAALEVFTDSRFKKDMLSENRKLKELVTQDELTKAYNRRYIDFSLGARISKANEFNQKFGIIFIDIDDFKYVNDNYGHNIGDEILKLVSRTVGSNLRGKDIFGRWGGEEFIVICEVDSDKELGVVCDKLRFLVQNSSYQHDDELITVTISLGASLYQADDTNQTIVGRADEAMYESKNTGKNKFTIY